MTPRTWTLRVACSSTAKQCCLVSSIKQSELGKDEPALFEIANKVNLRHQDKAQHGDYDPLFFDWIFWWFLATIDLIDRLAARSSTSDSD